MSERVITKTDNNPPDPIKIEIDRLTEQTLPMDKRGKELRAACDRAAKITIENEETAEAFTDQIKQIDEAHKALEGMRTSALAPIDALRQAVHNHFTKRQLLLVDMKDGLKRQLNAWQLLKRQREEDRRREEAEKARKAADEARKLREKAEQEAEAARIAAEAQQTEASEEAAEDAERIARLARRQETSAEVVEHHATKQADDTKSINKAGQVRGNYGGQASLRKVLGFEILNVKKIPREYLMVDEAKIRREINQGGVTKIAGIRIFETNNTVTK